MVFARNKCIKCSISSFALVMILTSAGILITTACVATTISRFSEDAAVKMANQISNIIMERSTFRIRGVLERATGIAAAAQTSIFMAPSAPLPYQDRQSDWYVKWQSWGMAYEKSLNFQAQSAGFFFTDGSYSSVSGSIVPDSLQNLEQRVIVYGHVLGNNTPTSLVSNGTGLVWTVTNVTLYDYKTLRYMLNYRAIVQLDPRQRIAAGKMGKFASQWSQAVVSYDGRTPLIRLSYTLYNSSDYFLGIGDVSIKLETFRELAYTQLPTPNSQILILGRYRKVLASSLRDSPTLVNTSVPLGYSMSAEEEKNGCSMAASNNPNYNMKFLICFKDPMTFGYAPLREINEMGLIKTTSSTGKYIGRAVSREKLGDLGYYYVSIVDYYAYFPTLDWVAVIVIPEEEILRDIREGRNIAIGTSAGLVVLLTLVNGIVMWLFLKPLSQIVFQMQSASYLKEEASNPSKSSSSSRVTSSDESAGANATTDTQSSQKQKEKRLSKAMVAAEKLNSNRTPSYLSDVAAIQTAYWGMVDELGVLKSYIPEHIREQLLDVRKQKVIKSFSQGTDEIQGGDSTKQKVHLNGSGHSEFSLVDASPTEYINEWAVSASSGKDSSSVSQLQAAVNQKEEMAPSPSQLKAPSGSQSSGGAAEAVATKEEENVGPKTHHVKNPSLDVESPGSADRNNLLLLNNHAETTVLNKQTVDDLPYFSRKKKARGLDNFLPIPIHDLHPLSTRASTQRAAEFASLGNLTNINDVKPTSQSIEPLPLFAENGLVERNIAVALINLVGFHQYVFSTSIAKAINAHEYLVSYIHEVAKRCGGTLDHFNGEKFWVSFNASTPCEEIHVTATMFAHEVATTINKEASLYRASRLKHQQRSANLPPLSPQRPRFQVALRGVTIGVAAGRAYVGPLGTKKIRRHTIISNAIAEAAALERMAARYPDCGVMVGGDMIPAIEGYFQYILLDATTLPGSSLRRRIASIKGNMLAPNCRHIPFLLSTALKLINPIPSSNPYDAINECFNAFLEGRTTEVNRRLREISKYVELSRQIHQINSPFHQLPDGRPILSPIECNNILLMLQFLTSMGDDFDGRQYRSPLGNIFETVDSKN